MSDDAGERNKAWRLAVKLVARAHIPRLPDGPIALYIEFVMPRPKAHYGKKGLKASAPDYHINKPDMTKLIRSTEDALTDAGIWRDDSQVANQCAVKVYGDEVGANITIYSGEDFLKCPALRPKD